jgi:hypothetical protein
VLSSLIFMTRFHLVEEAVDEAEVPLCNPRGGGRSHISRPDRDLLLLIGFQILPTQTAA